MKSGPALAWIACIRFLTFSERMRMLAVRKECAGVSPFKEWTVLALKCRADLLDGVARAIRSKNVSCVGQMTE